MTQTASSVVDEREARRTTRQLVGKSEGVALLVQAGNIVMTASVDKIAPSGQGFLYFLALLHGIGAFATLKKSGPFARGGPWLVLWFGVIIAMPLVMAHLVGANEYGASPACVQLCGYAVAPLVIFAFYPWWSLQRARLRPVLEYGILAVVVIEPLLLVLYLHQNPGRANFLSVGATALINILAFAVGKAVGKMCRNAVEAQIRLHDEHNDAFLNWMHVEIKDRIMMIRNSIGRQDEVVKFLDEIERVLEEGKVKVTLTGQRVPLADLFSRRMHVFDKQIDIKPPRIGAVTADRDAAILLDQCLSDFLTNSVRYGATSAQVGFRTDGGVAILEVCDNGPGFSSDVLENQTTSLNRSRKRARQLGGDLRKCGESKDGACIALSVPLYVSERNASGRLL